MLICRVSETSILTQRSQLTCSYVLSQGYRCDNHPADDLTTTSNEVLHQKLPRQKGIARDFKYLTCRSYLIRLYSDMLQSETYEGSNRHGLHFQHVRQDIDVSRQEIYHGSRFASARMAPNEHQFFVDVDQPVV